MNSATLHSQTTVRKWRSTKTT